MEAEIRDPSTERGYRVSWVVWRGEKYMPRSRQVAGGGKAGGKEADGKWEKTEESINREPFSCI